MPSKPPPGGDIKGLRDGARAAYAARLPRERGAFPLAHSRSVYARIMRSTNDAAPQSNDALVAQYSPLVRRLVDRHVCFGISHEDAVSEIWVRVLGSQILERFKRARRKRSRLLFRAYFTVTVRNHLKNMFRTLERRFNSENPSLCHHNDFDFECEWCRPSEFDAQTCRIVLNAEIGSQAFRYRMTQEQFHAQVRALQ